MILAVLLRVVEAVLVGSPPHACRPALDDLSVCPICHRDPSS